MEIIFRICGIAVVSVICICVIRQSAGPLSYVLSAAACVMILLLSLRFIKPVLELFRRLETLGNISSAASAPLMKVTGIGILARVAGGVCEDAGETTLHRSVQMAATVLSLYVSLPLLSAVLDLLEQLIGG